MILSMCFRLHMIAGLMIFSSSLVLSQNVELDQIADGFNRPCEITHAGDERLFVVEQDGKIKILLPDGTVLENPFLDIEDIVDSSGSEKGLLGLAFPPDYCSSGSFYVNYTYTENNQLFTRISRFFVSDFDENIAVPASEEVQMQIAQDFSNHNGGHMEFGPDGYLYIGMGDGGSGGDPLNRAQALTSHLGKMLRIDVSTQPYTSPSDNPFFDDDFGLDEIWASGLRNPWKFAFDQETGELFIGDVGQNNREEVSYQPANSEGGINYGWRCYEGFSPYNLNNCAMDNYQDPVFDYAYGNQGNGFRCAITGGRVYRGPSFPNLYGKYLFSDYCAPEYWLLWEENGTWETSNSAGFTAGIVSYGEDVFGEMYAVHGSDGIYRVREAGESFLPQIQMNGNVLTSVLEGSSYVWLLDGIVIDGENGMSINAAESGSYVAQIISESGCVVTTTAIDFVISSSVDHAFVQTFKIFPNPSVGVIWVEAMLRTSVNDLRVDIYSVDGKKIHSHTMGSSERAEIDLSHFAPGIYFVQLMHASEKMAIRKVVRQ